MNENQEKINKEIEEEKRYIAVEKNISKRIMSKKSILKIELKILSLLEKEFLIMLQNLVVVGSLL